MSTTWRIIEGDCRASLAGLPERSVQMCVTSPPYFGLRDYGHDGQIGLEPTPDEFVAALVAVFREVWRVLRDDGTVWLNLGDSYAGSWGNQGRKSERGTQRPINGEMLTPVLDGRYPANESNTGAVPMGLKPKDLMGIPWRVAFALQQPWYSGTIKDERDRIWLAAMIDAEGCMFIHKRKVGQNNGQGYARKNDSYGAGLEVSSTDRCIVERIMQITGRGSICEQAAGTYGRKQTLYRWNLRSNECREVIREVYPHLVAKQHEARLVLGCPSSGPDAERAHESLKAIHQGGTPDIDFAPPASMFERGWCLRSDVIWAKLCRTRCRRASRTGRRRRTSTCSCCRRGHGTSMTLTRYGSRTRRVSGTASGLATRQAHRRRTTSTRVGTLSDGMAPGCRSTRLAVTSGPSGRSPRSRTPARISQHFPPS
jgi:hypothetical protein